MKESATAFIRAVKAGSGTCSKPALLAALDMADLSKATRKFIIYYSDGFNTCPGSDSVTYAAETLSEVTARNAGKLRINAICIGPASSVDEEWMRQLASENRGSYVRIVQ